ncbi:MAG: PAS domain S-box protein [Desulfobacteraceae bacterium]|jgi:PAS domain S-box-containing protein
MEEDLYSSELQYQLKKLEKETMCRKQVEDTLNSVRQELNEEIERRKKELEELKQDYENRLEEQNDYYRKIQQQEAYYRQIFNNLPDFVFSIDTNFYLLHISQSVKDFLGYMPNELIGKRFNGLKCITEKSRNKAMTHFMRLFSEEPLAPSIFTFIAKDGTHKMGELNGRPLLEEGESGLLICSVRDVSARGQVENEAFRRKMMEKDMEMAWSVYAGLKQPLASISNQADLILARIDESHPAHYLAGSLRGQLETLAQILLQISEISALEYSNA